MTFACLNHFKYITIIGSDQFSSVNRSIRSIHFKYSLHTIWGEIRGSARSNYRILPCLWRRKLLETEVCLIESNSPRTKELCSSSCIKCWSLLVTRAKYTALIDLLVYLQECPDSESLLVAEDGQRFYSERWIHCNIIPYLHDLFCHRQWNTRQSLQIEECLERWSGGITQWCRSTHLSLTRSSPVTVVDRTHVWRWGLKARGVTYLYI